MAARSLYAEQETKGILHESCDIPEKELISYRFLCCGPLTITLLVAGVRVELTTLGFSVPCYYQLSYNGMVRLTSLNGVLRSH